MSYSYDVNIINGLDSCLFGAFMSNHYSGYSDYCYGFQEQEEGGKIKGENDRLELGGRISRINRLHNFGINYLNSAEQTFGN